MSEKKKLKTFKLKPAPVKDDPLARAATWIELGDKMTAIKVLRMGFSSLSLIDAKRLADEIAEHVR